jgi:hypothetical protein
MGTVWNAVNDRRCDAGDQRGTALLTYAPKNHILCLYGIFRLYVVDTSVLLCYTMDHYFVDAIRPCDQLYL